MQHRIITAAHHRNGVGGAGFNVAIVETTGSDRDGQFLCIDFSGHPEDEDHDRGRFGVLRMDELIAGNIGMHPITDPDGVLQEGTGNNAWRGADYWGEDLRDEIRTWINDGYDAATRKRLEEQEAAQS